jgi:sterol desaturase/sphingolipid hydroxylase (fatty acid hydroxylase superfamily)
MMDILPFSETTIRLAAFLAIFATMAVLELSLPRRDPNAAKGARWRTNLAMVAVDSIVLRIVFPMAAVGTAIWADGRGYGLFRAVETPGIVAGIIAFIVLDFAVWLEHFASHKIPILWRIHRMHHSDIDFDVTTALRFHPLEIILSMVWKAGVVIALGAPVLAVLAFEIVLNGAAMFNHSNVKLPLRADRLLRRLIVTPDMHRIHHSIRYNEMDTNYGFNFAFWDRLFGTYSLEPEDGHSAMTIGLPDYQDTAPTGLIWSLVLPFRRN